mmetsp:Transcript_28074/g.52686  ORF Transcript_28074/g.52686 Transcript_28074/m.52686 type:complete len:533 (+) Transcript_28074:150-1748(+)
MADVTEHDEISDVETGKSPSSLFDTLPVAIADPDGLENNDPLIVAEVVSPIDQLSLYEEIPSVPAVQQRPSLISVVCFSERPMISFAIAFCSVNGELKIKSILPGSPLQVTSLRPGDQVIALDNNRHCSRWSAVEAEKYVQSRTGHFSVLVATRGDPNLHEAIVCKSDTEQKVGIIFRNDEQSRLRIKRLNTDALIGRLSALKDGDFVISINNSPAHFMDSHVATTVVRTTPSLTSIVVKQTDSSDLLLRHMDSIPGSGSTSFAASTAVDAANGLPTVMDEVNTNNYHLSTSEYNYYMEQQDIKPRFVYVKCEKPTADSKLGIAFDDDTNQLTIRSINSSGVLWSSPLQEGFDVLAIDGKGCTHWSKREALDYLKTRVSDISIVARNPIGDSRYVEAQVTKISPRSQVGLTFKKNGSGPLKIGSVFPTGLFAGSILNDGYEVISINGYPSRSLTTSEAVAIVDHATDTVKIVAAADSETGIVLASLDPSEAPRNIIPTTTHISDHEKSNPWGALVVLSIAIAVMILLFRAGL